MSRTRSPLGQPLPPSAIVTAAATRRRFLQGGLLGATLLGAPALLTA